VVIGMIELGTGFHPDLSGEENIRLQGSIYGLTARQIEERMEEILAFAELGDFRAMPVKHYSSGMFVRLGFAIAVNTDPDVLLVDEVLAVGDLRFQEKCLRRIRQMREAGMTLLLVTHFPEQAERVCERVVWLDQGRVVRSGPAAQVLAEYHDDLIHKRFDKSEGKLDERVINFVGLPGRYGSGEARIKQVRLLNGAGAPRTSFERGEEMVIELDYSVQAGVDAVDCMVVLEVPGYDRMLTIWRALRDGQVGRPREGQGRFRLEVGDPMLAPGRYILTVALAPPERPSEHYDVFYKMFSFTIVGEEGWEPIAPIELRSAATR
jgi:energy-coupling factor transporter ATP-binding protein EcfA2